ncbi:hypothetical protein VB264_05290 [Arcicella aquatica]|uniref:Uncharacterized protein n=1 Tax=Arcicella aquatica TaxID=217141 RepID=A0ABU5QJE1_9BACT|nr:hypothetical protein [Arcicella aquatica]MEA5257191.1 hypothetical protein [Arcicella aquatica]
MKLPDLKKAINITENAKKAVAAIYGEVYANNLFAHVFNQLNHSIAHVEANKQYEGMSEEDVALLKEAERAEEIEALQQEMKERLELAYKVPVPLEEEEPVEDTADDVRPEPKI